MIREGVRCRDGLIGVEKSSHTRRLFSGSQNSPPLAPSTLLVVIRLDKGVKGEHLRTGARARKQAGGVQQDSPT